MEITARLVILPLVITSLLIGILQSLSTAWGLFRHYWVLAKLILTIVTLGVLLLQMGNIEHMAQWTAQATAPVADLLSLAVDAGGGLVVLVVVVALSIYKPRGMTPYGWRKAAQTSQARRPLTNA